MKVHIILIIFVDFFSQIDNFYFIFKFQNIYFSRDMYFQILFSNYFIESGNFWNIYLPIYT